ncbi:GNAT family protein [Microtetraspora malaysiensis]|uniref:N-acetyltransferase domain-containing protein n=1 Tax=Microtetraspora malaysiensis TaxID=161358 RepID=A0ABW6SKR8_9ACTN
MSRTASSPGDLELLDTETRVLWDVDARGRLPGPEALVIAATTAAWADLLSADCPHLFYSTSADNLSSQRVAGRLGLRAIGWLWKLTRKS